MSEPIETTEYKDPPKSFWGRFRYIGPSLILTATLVGSGELVITTLLGAELGFVALWIIIGTCVLKVALQETLGRFVVSAGETSLTTFDKLPGPRLVVGWAVWVWLAITLFTLLQLGGVVNVVGESVHLIFPVLSAEAWGPICCGLGFLILISGRYKLVERVSVILVSIFSISIIFCALLIQTTDYAISAADVASGFQFQLPESGGKALSVVAAAGLSATELMYYAYWCLEKGYARFTGPNDGTEAWQARAQGWIRVMRLDCYFAMVIYTTTTIAFYFLGAAILHRTGEIPEQADVVATLSSIYTKTIGPGAFYIFVISAFFVLFSTLFVSIASNARLMPDCLRVFGLISLDDDRSRRLWVKTFVCVFSALYVIGAFLPVGAVMKMIVGFVGLGLMLPMICFAALYLRYRRLDPALRPSPIMDVWLWASALLTVVLTIRAVVDLIQHGAHA